MVEEGGTKKRRVGAFLIVVGLLAALFSVFAPASGAVVQWNSQLKQSQVGSTNPGFATGDCPAGPEGYTWGWHFVQPPDGQTKYSFTQLQVQFANAGTVSSPSPRVILDGKHAYVYTATTDTILGASAVIAPNPASPPEEFVLSHVCAGSGGTPPGSNSLTVTKQVTGTTNVARFGINVTCSDGETTWDGIDANLPSNDPRVVDQAGDDGVLNLSLADGESYKIDGIPPGYTCTVTEPDGSPSFQDSEGANDGVVTFPDAVVCLSAVTNPCQQTYADHFVQLTNTFRDANTLTVRKVVSGSSAQKALRYPVDVSCEWDGAWNGVDDPANLSTTATPPIVDTTDDAVLNLSLTDNESVTISNIPQSSTCTVTETDAHGATKSYSLDEDAQAAGAQVEYGREPESNTVTVTNRFSTGGGDIVITQNPTTTTTEAPTTTTSEAPAVVEGVQIEQTTTTTTAAAPLQVLGVQLARTGAETRQLLFVAGLALLLGGAAVIASDKLANRRA